MDTHGTGPGLTSDTTQWRAGCGANSHARFGGRPAETDPPKDGHRAAGRPHLGTAVVDDVRRRVQQDILGHRGHKDEPLYKIRGLLRRGAQHLSQRQLDKLNACLIAGDPDWEVTLAWHAYQRLRGIYQALDPGVGRRLAEDVIASFPTCPVREIARLGRTLRAWRQHVLARFEVAAAGAGRVSNGGTEAVNLLIEKTRRLAHGFRTFDHYRIRILLTASGSRRYAPGPTMDRSEEPLNRGWARWRVPAGARSLTAL